VPGPAPDVAIIGGGIVGTATAAFLAEAGLSVRLYERTAIAAGASGRNSGIVQHPFDPVMADLYRRSVEEYRRLGTSSDDGFRLPDEPAGLLLVGRDADHAREVADQWAATWPGTRPEILSGSALHALEPSLARDLVAVRLEIGFLVAPAAATDAFAGLARRNGAEVRLESDVGVATDDGRAVGVRVGDTVEAAGSVVVAAGPWTPALVDPSGSWRPIRPIWGVVASIDLARAPRHGVEAIDINIEPEDRRRPTDDPVSVRADAADVGVDFSLIPAAGSSALGSTFLTDEPDPGQWIEALRRVGSRYVPAVAAAPLVAMRSCARPVSRDGRPFVGRAPSVHGLWLIAGHGPWGISTGPGSARLLAKLMRGGGRDPIPAALAVDRLG